MNIMQLADNFLAVQEMVSSECDNQALLDTLESIECAIEVKVENTVYVIENAKADSEALGSVIKRLQAKQKAIDNNIERTQSFLFNNLEAMGIDSIKAGIFTVKQVKNPASVIIENEQEIPAKYVTVIPESYKVSKTDIAKDLKAGIEVPGATLQQTKRWAIK